MRRARPGYHFQRKTYDETLPGLKFGWNCDVSAKTGTGGHRWIPRDQHENNTHVFPGPQTCETPRTVNFGGELKGVYENDENYYKAGNQLPEGNGEYEIRMTTWGSKNGPLENVHLPDWPYYPCPKEQNMGGSVLKGVRNVGRWWYAESSGRTANAHWNGIGDATFVLSRSEGVRDLEACTLPRFPT